MSKKNISIIILSISILTVGLYFKRNHMTRPTDTTEQTNTTKITRTNSGLGYTVLTAPQADAQQPQAGQTVVVHYTGWLDDEGNPGAKFDSSVDRGTPFEFPVGMGYVIAGWDEALAAMKVGEKRRIYLPASLGYGARGAGAVIPPHANLIFDVELLEVK